MSRATEESQESNVEQIENSRAIENKKKIKETRQETIARPKRAR